MSVLQIVCQNCGAKYKIPETFKGDKAKCKACGTVIDVAAQRDGEAPEADADAPAPKPAAVNPSAAKRATAKPKAAASRQPKSRDEEEAVAAPRKRRRAGSGAAGRRRRRGAGGDEDEGVTVGRRRRHAPEEEEKGSNAVLIGAGIVVVVAILVVVGIFMFGGKGQDPAESTTDQTANSGDAAAADADATEDPDAAQPDPDEAAQPDAEPTPDPAAEAAAEEAAKKAAAEARAKEVAAALAASGGEITSRDQVFDPSTLPEVPFPEDTSQELQDEVDELVQAVFDGGLQGSRAKTRLEKIGYPSLFGIINRLRTIDYFDSRDSMTGYELNRLLEAMAIGINVGYRPPQIGEEQELKDVDWNAKTAKAWHRLPELYPSAERFEEMRKKRNTRNMGR